MTKTLLDPCSADRLAKIASMFGSEYAGERATAAAHAHALILRLGLTWHDVISRVPEPQPDATAVRRDWRQMAHACGTNAHRFRPHEEKFIRDMRVARRGPTKKQLGWLTSLYERLIDDFGQQSKTRQ